MSEPSALRPFAAVAGCRTGTKSKNPDGDPPVGIDDKRQNAHFGTKNRNPDARLSGASPQGQYTCTRSDTDPKLLTPTPVCRKHNHIEQKKKNRNLAVAVSPSDRVSIGQRERRYEKLFRFLFYQCLFLAAMVAPARVRTAITATIAVASPVWGGLVTGGLITGGLVTGGTITVLALNSTFW